MVGEAYLVREMRHSAVVIHVGAVVVECLGDFLGGMAAGPLVEHVEHGGGRDGPGLVVRSRREGDVNLEHLLRGVVQIDDFNAVGQLFFLILPQRRAVYGGDRWRYVSVYHDCVCYFLFFRYHSVEQFSGENMARAVFLMVSTEMFR